MRRLVDGDLMRVSIWLALALVGLSPAFTSPARAQAWDTTTGAGGYKVARVAMTGGASGFGLACEGALPVLAINLRQPPRRNPALLTLRIGAASGAIVITRNGATNVWGAAVRDPRVLNALASGQSVALAVDGVAYGSVPLTGAGEAMREALGGCWAGAQLAGSGRASSARGNPAATSSPQITGLGEVMAVADTSSPVTVQTSFPTRDPNTGKPRLPVKLGAWIPAGATCARPSDGLIFIDSGDGAYAFPHQNAESIVEAIRLTKPGTYVAREAVAAGDTAIDNATYNVVDPEHFSVTRHGSRQSYSFCAQAALPQERRHFLASEYRRVAALPVKAGYYRMGQMGEGNQSNRCIDQCGFALVTSVGIASTAPSGTGNSREVDRQIRKFNSVTQHAPFEYVTIGTSDAGGGIFTIKSVEEFSEYDYSGDVTYRYVDPARIPAAMMPRF